jgi:hypothetical protein
MTSNMAITKIESMDGKLSRISCHQPQLRWWSGWPPDLNFGRQKQRPIY